QLKVLPFTRSLTTLLWISSGATSSKNVTVVRITSAIWCGQLTAKYSEKWCSAAGIRSAASIVFQQGPPNEVDQTVNCKGLFEHPGYAQARGQLLGVRVEPTRNQDRRDSGSFF